MSNFTISEKNIYSALVAFFVFFSFNPFFFWGFDGFVFFRSAFDVFFIFVSFFVFYRYGFNNKYLLIFFPLLAWCAYRFYNPNYGIEYLEFAKVFIKASLILLYPSFILMRSFKYTRLIILFFAFFSILSSLFVFFLGNAFFEFNLINPYEIKEKDGQSYIGYVFGSYIDSFKSCSNGFCTFRNNGPFDEPGYWGTFLGLYIAARRVQLSSFEFKILFLSGVATFSLAFFILIFIYFITSQIRNILSSALLFSFIFLPLIIFFPLVFDQYFISRLSFESIFLDRGAGLLFFEILNFDFFDLIFGKGFGLGHQLAYGSSSWLLYLYDGGILLILSTFLFYYLLHLFYVRTNNSLLLLIFFIASFIQRPDIIWVGYIYIFLLSKRKY